MLTVETQILLIGLTMTSSFDLWPWKPFQQCLLTTWIFVADFIEIVRPSSPVSRDTSKRQMDGRTT